MKQLDCYSEFNREGLVLAGGTDRVGQDIAELGMLRSLTRTSRGDRPA